MVSKKDLSCLFYIFLIPAILIALDQATKLFAKIYLESPILIIKNILSLTLVMNHGIAFGLFQGANDIIVWLYIIVLGLIIYFYDKFPKGTFNCIMLSLIITGVVGNFIDRLFLGYVVDFISLRFWPVFNVADICLCVGIIGILGKEILKKKD